jgi:hypothetical protein
VQENEPFYFLPVVVDLNLSDHRLLKVVPSVINRVFNHPLLTPFHFKPPPREIRHVTDTQQYPISEDEYLFTVTISQVSDLTTPKAKVQVLIDSGASINVIDEKASSRHQEISAE